MVMVTHNIQEAVLMARKIVVLAAHPGRVQTVVDNTLPYPRDTDSPAFKHLVDQIHGILTQAILPDGPATSVDVTVPASEESSQAEAEASHAEHAAGRQVSHVVPVSPLPKALLSEVQGLISYLGDEPEEIYDLSSQIGKDFAATLSVVKAAEMLGFVDTPGQDVVLTALGKRFNGLGTPEKREILHEQIRKIKIFELILRLIDNSPEKMLEEDVIVERLGRIFPHERARTLWKTILSWGRYAEIFGYDAHTHQVSRFERVVFTEPEEPETAA
jgi:NitT/TauT family transport system ATP-binding protein